MKYLFLLFITLSLLSCTDSVVYEDKFSVNENAWNYKDSLVFGFDVDDVNQSYNLLVDLKFKNTYPYSNLFFFVDITDPRNVLKRDTIECFLALSNGKWIGEESGGYVEQKLILKYNVNFPQKGHYGIVFKHAMRDTLLKKVSEVGLELHKYSESK